MKEVRKEGGGIIKIVAQNRWDGNNYNSIYWRFRQDPVTNINKLF